MNKKFDTWMNSIDDTYLEEAARPAKEKISYRALVLAAAACLVLTATGLILRHAVLSEGSATPDTTLAKNQETEDGITKEQFTKEGISYTLLTCTANESTDISGMEASDTEPLVWVAGGLELKLCSTKDIAWSSWYDTNTNTQWCLKANTSSLALLTTAKDIVEELGYNVAVAPEGATDITYDAFLLNDLTVAETTFVLDGIRYSYRMAATYEITEDFADISGTGNQYDVIATSEVGWCPAKIFYTENNSGKIIWFDIVPGLLYSLSMETNASEEALLQMAHELFTPAQ